MRLTKVFVLSFLLSVGASSSAFAQCTGQAPAQTFCGNNTGSLALPAFKPLSGIVPVGSALTKTNDTNVTLTLTGTPATSLLQAVQIAVGWTGQLAVGRGGTGLASGTSGGIPYFNSTTTMALSGVLAGSNVVVGGGAGAAPFTVSFAANQVVVGASSGGGLTTVGSGTTTTLLHGGSPPSFGSVVSADLNITPTTCTNQFISAISATGVGTCSTAARLLLSADTTFWRRSDGSDTVGVCNGTANAAAASTPNCAKQTWNVLYTTVIAAYDFNGKTITLKSGTADTISGANVGLTMGVSYVGGGALVIDLNGSNIAETATKGIINNAPQPSGMTIQNSAGLGVGGNISSFGFACIQQSAPGIIGIGVGISTGPCGDAAYEAIQGGGIALAAPVNSIGGGGNQFVLTASSGFFGFNGQTVNHLTNQTYTVGYSTATGGTILATGVTFSLGGHTITGPRYSVTLNGSIYTGGGGANYFPGTTAGIGDSGGCYDSICYGSLADGTPMLGSLLSTSIGAPTTPAAGKSSIFTNNAAGGALQAKDPSGLIWTTIRPQTAAANNFLTGFDVFGFQIVAQPAFSNLSGQATLAQLPTLTANTVLANATSGAAVPTAFGMPSCATNTGVHLQWLTNTGFQCATLSASDISTGTLPSGRIGFAAKADMQTPSSSTLVVNPRDVQDHPGTAKFQARLDGKTGTTCTITASYNITSCVRNSSGNYTLTFTTAFANANYNISGVGWESGVNAGAIGVTTAGSMTTTTLTFICFIPATGTTHDCDNMSIQGWGTQ